MQATILYSSSAPSATSRRPSPLARLAVPTSSMGDEKHQPLTPPAILITPSSPVQERAEFLFPSPPAYYEPEKLSPTVQRRSFAWQQQQFYLQQQQQQQHYAGAWSASKRIRVIIILLAVLFFLLHLFVLPSVETDVFGDVFGIPSSHRHGAPAEVVDGLLASVALAQPSPIPVSAATTMTLDDLHF